jgi:hypothetical protein
MDDPLQTLHIFLYDLPKLVKFLYLLTLCPLILEILVPPLATTFHQFSHPIQSHIVAFKPNPLLLWDLDHSQKPPNAPKIHSLLQSHTNSTTLLDFKWEM